MHFTSPLLLTLVPAAAGLALWLRRGAGWRAGAAVCAVLAAAGPRRGAEGLPPICRVYVLDASASVGGPAEALALAKADAQDLGEGDLAAVVAVGAIARVELAPAEPARLRNLRQVQAKVPGGASRLGEGIDAAASLVPETRRGEIVVLSDGREVPANGAAAVAAASARRRGFAVRSLPCGAAWLADARVDRVEAPGRVRAGERFDAVVTVSASHPTRARVSLGGASRDLVLEPGAPARVAFPRPPPAGALEWLEARVEALDFADALPADNSHEAPVLREGALPVLVLAPEPGRAAETALTADPRFGVSTAARPADLALFSAVVLDGLPAADLGDPALTSLRDFVESGGGVLALGGPDGFGAGGYGATPLDPALPVKSAPEEGFTLVVLLDASGSMNEEASPGRPKLVEAREALRGLVSTALPGTVFSFLAFAEIPRWIHAPTADRAALLRAVEALDAGGPTRLLPALEKGKDAAAGGGRRHVVLVSDGKTAEDEAALVAATDAIRAGGATLSAVAEGADANLALLKKLAPDRVWIISSFAELARALREDLAREQGLTAKGAFDVPGRPRVLQLNTVQPKDGAETLLEASGRPLAALHRFGKGRCAAFASALDPEWVADRPAWGAEVAALVARVARPDTGGRLTLAIDGDDLVATWSPAESGDAASVPAELTLPDGATARLDLLRAGPTLFRARTRVPHTGRFVLSAAGTRAAASRPWPAELAATGPRPDLLAALAGPPTGPPAATLPSTDLAPWLLAIAVVAVACEFLVDRLKSVSIPGRKIDSVQAH